MKALIPIPLFGPQHPGYVGAFNQGWQWMDTANTSSCHNVRFDMIDPIVAADATAVVWPGKTPLSVRFFGFTYLTQDISSKQEFELGEVDFPAHEGPMPRGADIGVALIAAQKRLIAQGTPSAYLAFQIWGNNDPAGEARYQSTVYRMCIDIYTDGEK